MLNNHMRLSFCALAVGVCASLAVAQEGEVLGGSNPALPQPTELRLSFEEANALASHPRWLSLKYAEFDTSGESPARPEDLSAPAARPGERGYFLVQFQGPIGEEHHLRAADLGVELLDYVPNYAFIARGTAEQRALLGEQAETVWTGDFHPAYRLDERLRLASEEAEYDNVALRLVVSAFQGVDRATLDAQLAQLGLRAVEGDTETGRWVVIVVGTARQARALSRARDVQWIEPEGVYTTRNTNATWAVQTFVNLSRRVWDQGIRGEGQVIGHVDSSLAVASCYFSDPSGAPVGPTHRKLVYVGGSGSSSHGTHTAGSAAGDSQPVNGSTANRGMAYLAKLAHTNSTSGFSTTLATHRNNGARVHTNSWGNDGTTSYDSLCNTIDSFSWNNEDNLVLFAVTNTSTLKNPDNAKNLLAVGASQNGASGNSFCSGGSGPTADGRRKPEVFAPGCNITSASTASCGTTSQTGTSMASPLAAGAAALVRQYFMNGYYPSGAAVPGDAFTPTGALVKAVMVNCTADMTGIGGYPSNQEGWGRLLLDQSLFFPGDQIKMIVQDVRRAQGLSTGQSATLQFNVVSSAAQLEVTLAFHDAPGTINAANPVINNLDLRVTSPTGAIYLGNVFSGGFSTTVGSADAKNNVERVALNSPTIGVWTVEILGTNIPQSGQGYGLCITGDVTTGSISSSNPVNYCTAGLTSSFCQATMSSTGVAHVGAPSGFVVTADFVEGAKQGILFYGVSGRANAVWAPGSGSFLCVKTPVQRMSTSNSGGNAGQCNGALSIDWSSYVAGNPGALGNPFSAGAVINVQAWFRDPPAPGTTNLSDGLEFTVQP